LWFEGPLQSWGHDSRFDRRDSLPFPTKSGVLGLVCCALGAGGKQTELLAQFASLDMQIWGLGRQDLQGKRVPSEPLLRDFHMVGSGYDDADPWQSLLIPKTRDGKKAVGGGTKMTYRYYLQDMAFAVMLQVPTSLARQVADALQHPVWDLYLGRKCCVPTEFIFQGCFQDLEQITQAAEQLANNKNRARQYRVLQGSHEGDVLTVNDIPIQFGEQKRYRDRQITIIPDELLL
jgi:CRISPR system Cascade subunit CasD